MTARTSPKQVRGERLVEKVFASAAAEIARIGHQHISIEEVAARAGVNKTSIYRRWPTPDRLVLDMFERGADANHDPPDTGTLRGDLVSYVRQYEVIRGDPITMAIVRMHAASGFVGELADLLLKITERDRTDVLRMFERGVARGELPRGASPELGYDLVHGALMELTLTRSGEGPEVRAARKVERLVEVILLGLASVAMHEATGKRRSVTPR